MSFITECDFCVKYNRYFHGRRYSTKTLNSCFSFSNDLIIYARITLLVIMSTTIKSFKGSKFSMTVSNFINSSAQDTIRDWHFRHLILCND